jgi:biotin operon repressor
MGSQHVKMKPRLVSRLSSEYLLWFLGQVRQAFDGDVIKGVIFLAITQANVRHIDEGSPAGWTELDNPPPDNLRRPVSAGAVAQALGIPKETARRKIRELVSARFCALAPGGVIVPRRVFLRPGNATGLKRNAEQLRALFSALQRYEVGLVRRYSLAIGAARLRQLGRVTTDFTLRATGILRGLSDGELLAGLIFLAINAANVRHITAASEAVYATAEDPPPDAQRHPISALALSRELGIPAEAVRRHVRQLEASGYCVAVKGGLVVPTQVLMQPKFKAAVIQAAENLVWLLEELVRVGVLLPRPELSRPEPVAG